MLKPAFKVGDRVTINLPALKTLEYHSDNVFYHREANGYITSEMLEYNTKSATIIYAYPDTNNYIYLDIDSQSCYWREEWLLPKDATSSINFYGALKDLLLKNNE